MPDAVLTPSHFGDLQVGTLAHIEYMNFSEITSDLTDFLFMSQVINDVQVKTVRGKSFSWKVMVNDNGAAANVGLNYPDAPQNVDTLVDATAEWRNVKTDWTTVHQVDAMNSGPEQIVDEKLVQEKAAMISLVKLMEANWFGPSVSSTDNVTPWGMKTWITRQNGSTAYSSDGFVGGKLTAGPTLGLSDTTYTRWRNWYGQYTGNPTYDDFVRRLKKAMRRTNFKPPVDGIPKLGGLGPRRAMYSNEALIAGIEELLQQSNENIGFDVTKYLGTVVIQRAPVHYVPYLDADTTNPLYCMDSSKVFLYRLEGFWMRRVHFENYPGYHNSRADFIDTTYMPVFVDRRSSFVLATSVTDPT